MKKILNLLFSRLFYVGLALLIQLIWILTLILMLNNYSKYVSAAITVISFLAVLKLVNKRINPSYKLAWTFLILVIPVFGAVLYLVFGKSRIAKKVHKQFLALNKVYEKEMVGDLSTRKKIRKMDKNIANQSYYMESHAHSPLYENTTTEYFAVGEDMFAAMVTALREAKHFIFMEYFIIHRGEMWDTILEILEEKVKEGVDIRLIYDDMGCVTTLPVGYYKILQSKGIKCAAFNPFRPMLSVIHNNRDHRKIMVIDGYIGFTGGINLADEYINRASRFGHWKDTGVMIQGEAVWSFTVMFLQMWTVVTGVESNFLDFKPDTFHPGEFSSDGFVQPYSDTPLDNETVGENVYLNLISKAKDYIYIFTPYLIIDNEMMEGLSLAAKSGVDVRIITPHIPDKKLVFILTRSYYSQLVDAGVKIYEYNPGFIHAKSFVCDDEVAVVGTINMDYRSLYLHFECGVWMYKSKAVMQVKNDTITTLQYCTLITKEFCQNQHLLTKGMQSVLRLFAPML